jgi:cytosine/adenosine deaminase-related metal-dependent hydrolase
MAILVMAALALLFAFIVPYLSFFSNTHTSYPCRLTHSSNSSKLILRGTLLTSAGALPNTFISIQHKLITHVGANLPNVVEQYSLLDCGDSVISPGFINTHEHIEYSTVNPLSSPNETYNHRHDWRVGARNHTPLSTEVNGSIDDAATWGEIRHIFSGTTSIVGGTMARGLTRNLDFAVGLEDGLHGREVVWDVFPLDDDAGILRNGDCEYGAVPITEEVAGRYHRYLAHVSEGVDNEAENEFSCLSKPSFDTASLAGLEDRWRSTDIIAPNLALVHALGLSSSDFDLVAKRMAMVVWSPRSNVFLYGKTLNVSYLLKIGITVALGTDWLPTGSATIGREAVCARDVMEKSYGVKLEPKTIWEMMTINAAIVAGFEKELGSIEVGKVADIVIFSAGEGKKEEEAFAQAVFAPSEDIELVMRGGKVLVAGKGLEDLTREDCEVVKWGATEKTVCVKGEIRESFGELERRLGGVYPAVLPNVPENEPSCEPRI